MQFQAEKRNSLSLNSEKRKNPLYPKFDLSQTNTIKVENVEKEIMEAEVSEEINSSLRSHMEEVNDPKLDFTSNKSSPTEISRQ